MENNIESKSTKVTINDNNNNNNNNNNNDNKKESNETIERFMREALIQVH